MASFHINVVVRDSLLGRLQQSVTAVIKRVNLTQYIWHLLAMPIRSSKNWLKLYDFMMLNANSSENNLIIKKIYIYHEMYYYYYYYYLFFIYLFIL